jgi:hypothetical protein
MKLLVLATETIPEDDVREIVEANEDEGAEVLVLTPAVVDSPLKFWVSDIDAARVSAKATADELASEFEDAGASVEGQVGDADPRMAIEDAMRTFDPDRVLVVKHPSDDEAYREDSLTDHLIETVDVPVEVRNIARDES